MMLKMIGSAMVAAMVLGVASEKYEGDEPFTPTKAEWFAIEMNCVFKGVDGNGGINVHFVPRGEKMLIEIAYSTDAQKPAAERIADVVTSRAKQAARNRNWDGWIEYDLRIERVTK